MRVSVLFILVNWLLNNGYFVWIMKMKFLSCWDFWWNRWFRISPMQSETGLSRLLWSRLMEMKTLLMFVWLSLEALWVRFLHHKLWFCFFESCFIHFHRLWKSIMIFLLIYRGYWVYAVYWGSTAIILSSGYDSIFCFLTNFSYFCI